MNKALTRPRPEVVVEGDIVVRSPPMPMGRVLAMAAFLLLFVVWHNWLYGHPRPWVLRPPEIFIFFCVAMLGLMKFVIAPAWIRIGRGGLAFGQGASERRYSWSQVRWFIVKEERAGLYGFYRSRGPAAFVTLSAPSGVLSRDAVRLPRVQGFSPEELVALLEEKRHIYAG